MNVFEDLLVDLKHENLLEDTVLDERPDAFTQHEDDTVLLSAELADEQIEEIEPTISVDNQDADLVSIATTAPSAHDSGFLKKRAITEVSGLQMVEHVLTGVEREYLKVKPQNFDDLKTKLALNRFLQAADGAGDEQERRAADIALMQEIEAWCAALAIRDKQVGVGSLRQYCENTRPALSSQALVALCRFYRNLPYSESVRSKFDFLLTRLFSRDCQNNERICLFKRDQAERHLENLYKEWASVPLYSADNDESKVMLTALSFDELAAESEQASTFDMLIESDFFSRLRMFKESIAELFLAPSVAIAAVEANVRIGNSYVKLIAAERQKMDGDSIQAKYSSVDHESFSDVTARTLDTLRSAPLSRPDPVENIPEPPAERIEFSFADQKDIRPGSQHSKAAAEAAGKRSFSNAFGVSKRILIFAGAMIAVAVGLFVWANYFVEETVPSSGVRTISADNAVVNEYVKTAKVSNEIFYGVVNEKWEALHKDKRTEFVQRLLAMGADQGFTQVSLMTSDGKPAAYASRRRPEVQLP